MKKILFHFFLLTFFATVANAQPVIEIQTAEPGCSSTRHIGQHATYFLDSTAKLTIDEVASAEIQKLFKPTNATQSTFGITPSVMWLHVRLVAPPVDGPWYLQAEPPMVDNVRLYKKTKAGWEISQSGAHYPVDVREVKSNTIIFPLDLAPGDTAEYFIRTESSFPLFVFLKTGTARDFWKFQSENSLYYGIFIGIMLLMILYNLFLFFTNRDRVYIYYVVYVFFCVVFISFTSGYAIFFPEFFRKLHMFNHLVIPAVFGTFGLLFTMRFLYTKKYAPRLHKLIYVLMGVVFIAMFFDFYSRHLGTVTIQLLGGVFALFSIVLGITVHRAGFVPARYYLFGFGIYMLGLCTYILLAVARIETGEVLSYYFLMASSAIETIILSFAIGSKLNMAVRDKQEAQEEKLKAISLNEQLVREQNVVLERKVEERTHEITLQKDIIEEKNKDILSSIHYAKRIQRALLASDNLLNNNLPEHFILYKPKDIVSGDFYWADVAPDGKFLVLTGDCTGHGVPGAFMSLLNISIMHELTFGRNLSRPDQLLNTQRDAIIMALNPEGTDEVSKDGMDCVLCSYDFKNKKVEFACANNPLWIIRDKQVMEFKADKQPIGLHEGPKTNYTLHEVQLQTGDIVYTLTDGYSDQFGGPKGKKFKLSHLKEKLVEICDKPLSEQKEILERTFEQWKGDLEQVDDVLLIGIKIK
jgi:serine phosphatase RsbU (regulator of sigma subunit)